MYHHYHCSDQGFYLVDPSDEEFPLDPVASFTISNPRPEWGNVGLPLLGYHPHHLGHSSVTLRSVNLVCLLFHEGDASDRKDKIRKKKVLILPCVSNWMKGHANGHHGLRYSHNLLHPPGWIRHAHGPQKDKNKSKERPAKKKFLSRPASSTGWKDIPMVIIA